VSYRSSPRFFSRDLGYEPRSFAIIKLFTALRAFHLPCSPPNILLRRHLARFSQERQLLLSRFARNQSIYSLDNIPAAFASFPSPLFFSVCNLVAGTILDPSPSLFPIDPSLEAPPHLGSLLTQEGFLSSFLRLSDRERKELHVFPPLDPEGLSLAIEVNLRRSPAV